MRVLVKNYKNKIKSENKNQNENDDFSSNFDNNLVLDHRRYNYFSILKVFKLI